MLCQTFTNIFLKKWQSKIKEYLRIEKEIIRTDRKPTLLLMSTMGKLFHMIKLMNFLVDEYDGETFLHNEANAETRKVHIILDERQQHITKGN